MSSSTTDRRLGLNGNTAMKAPVVTSTTANITLSGTQTIDGIAVVADDRVLVMNQTTATENGVYDVSTGSWTRSLDFDGNLDIVKGTTLYVLGGTQAGYWRVATDNPITFDTTAITFERALANDISTYSYTAPGTGGVARALTDKLSDFISTADYSTSSQATAQSSGITPVFNAATGNVTFKSVTVSSALTVSGNINLTGSLISSISVSSLYHRVTPNYAKIINAPIFTALTTGVNSISAPSSLAIAVDCEVYCTASAAGTTGLREAIAIVYTSSLSTGEQGDMIAEFNERTGHTANDTLCTSIGVITAYLSSAGAPFFIAVTVDGGKYSNIKARNVGYYFA